MYNCEAFELILPILQNELNLDNMMHYTMGTLLRVQNI